jgi:Ca2+-binding EF-hand superfamily protein
VEKEVLEWVKNGLVTPEDIETAKWTFKKWDINGDGDISRTEVTKKMREEGLNDKISKEELWKRYFSNQKVKLTEAEFIPLYCEVFLGKEYEDLDNKVEVVDTRVECEHCTRKFDPKRIDTHKTHCP